MILTPANWTDPIDLDGLFPDKRPIEVDLGCGKGRFLTARASEHPDTNFIGIDRMKTRVLKTEKKVGGLGLKNVALLRIESWYAMTYLFPPESISVVYVFFPDPWPKRRHNRRRLFSESFLDSLYRALKPKGVIHVATDHQDYGDRIEKLFLADERFHEVPAFVPSQDERTEFELLFAGQGKSAKRVSFGRDAG